MCLVCVSWTGTFFFQAEDGIRDIGVTGVQTCALPIFGPAGTNVSIEREVFPALIERGLYGHVTDGYWLDVGTPQRYLQEIGRASCRERVEISVGVAALTKKHADISRAARIMEDQSYML